MGKGMKAGECDISEHHEPLEVPTACLESLQPWPSSITFLYPEAQTLGLTTTAGVAGEKVSGTLRSQ